MSSFRGFVHPSLEVDGRPGLGEQFGVACGAVAFRRLDVSRATDATSPGLAANLILSLGGSFVSAANTAKAKKTSEKISTTPKSFHHSALGRLEYIEKSGVA